ncbi:MAG: hypothetical protein QOI17_764 [Gaiellales bacterium]|nr:hypothetical protein [Gaiellales bacterium]
MSRADLALLVAAAACALAVLLLAVTVVLWVRLRRMRRGQKLLLGADQHDLVEYAVGLLARVEKVEARSDQVDRSVQQVTARLDGVLQRWALLRYDALDGAGGRQSVSMAVLDSASNGVVLTAIQDREYARMYVKQIVAGQSDLELSPEERRALEQAQATT